MKEVGDIFYAAQKTYQDFEELQRNSNLNTAKKTATSAGTAKPNSRSDNEPPYMKKIQTDTEKIITDLKSLMENKKKGFPLDNNIGKIIRSYDPNAKLTEHNNKSTVTHHTENLKRLIQANETKLNNLRQKRAVKTENRAFELNRGLYYKKLFNPGKEQMVDKSQLDDIKAF